MVKIKTKETEENVEDFILLDLDDKEILKVTTRGEIILRDVHLAQDDLLGRIIAAYSRWVKLASDNLNGGE